VQIVQGDNAGIEMIEKYILMMLKRRFHLRFMAPYLETNSIVYAFFSVNENVDPTPGALLTLIV
jgi:hypothetical protein